MGTLRVVPAGSYEALYTEPTLIFNPTDQKIHVQDASGRDIARINFSEQPAVYLALAATIARTYGQAPLPPPPAPAPAPEPTPVPPTATAFGLNGAAAWPARMEQALAATGVKWVRLDKAWMESTERANAAFAVAQRYGCRVICLCDSGMSASDMVTFARAHLRSADLIEFGNEDGYVAETRTYEVGKAYGERLKNFITAYRAAGLNHGILAQGDPAARGSGWIDGLYAALPNVHLLASGFTVHPYGPKVPTSSMDGYERRLANQHAQLTGHGAPGDVPIYITEWGISTDDGRTLDSNYGWPTALTYASAANDIEGGLKQFRQYATEGKYAIKVAVIYQDVDQANHGASSAREAYFGVIRRESGAAKVPLPERIRSLA